MLPALLPRPRVAFVPVEPYARGLAWLERSGHARDTILRDTGIDESELDHAEGLLTLDQVEGLIRNAASVLATPGGALDFGAELILPSHGVLGFAALTAPDVAGAIRVAEDFLELVTPLFLVDGEESDGGKTFRLVPRYRMAATVRQIHVRIVAGSLSVAARHAAGRIPSGIVVDVPDDQPDMAVWLRESGLDVRVGGELVVVHVPRDVLRIPFVLADARAHENALARCRELLGERRPKEQTIRDVRRVLREAGPPFPDLPSTGVRVGVSARTLRRRLEAEGSSYAELLEEARLSLAVRLLVRTDRDISAIAYEVGYSNPANFTRAFVRALSVAPSVYRRERLASHLENRAPIPSRPKDP